MPSKRRVLPSSIAALTARFRDASLSPVEVAEDTLDTIAHLEPLLRAFAWRSAEGDVLATAAASRARWAAGAPLGPLDGVPVTVKESLAVDGWPQRRGSRTTPCEALTYDAPAVARVRSDGAILLGATTMPEFGFKAVTDGPLWGITRNPWNTALTPGGSSGGSGAALAAGIGYASLGTDAAGSVRIPAAFTNLCALKPTAGRVPVHPHGPLGLMSHVGPMARSVEDVALVFERIAQPDHRDGLALPHRPIEALAMLRRGVRGVRIAFSPALGRPRVDDAISSALSRAARTFDALGAHVEEVDPPIGDLRGVMRTFLDSATLAVVSTIPVDRRRELDPGLAASFDRASKLSLLDYLDAQSARARFASAMASFHERFDLLLVPTTTCLPFAVGQATPAPKDDDWLDFCPFTFPWNLSGQPAVAIPCGFSDGGLPIGLQLVAAFDRDELALAAAFAFQETNPTAHAAPPLVQREAPR